MEIQWALEMFVLQVRENLVGDSRVWKISEKPQAQQLFSDKQPQPQMGDDYRITLQEISRD
jgi:hypothetical protein